MVQPATGAMWGADSLSWEYGSRWFNLVGGPRAAIMQTCDPKVAAGVAQYSSYRTDPFGRLERTMDAMLAISYGTPERREQVLADLRDMHRRVRGRTGGGAAYSALDPALMFWVLATLTDTIMVIDRRYIGRMRERDRERYYDESRQLADAFGIPERFVPEDLAEFRTYMADTVRSLRPDDDSREIARSLMQPGLKWVPDLAFVPLEWITTELLPTPLRRRLWIEDLNPAQLAAVRGAELMSRQTLPRLPGGLSPSPFMARAI